MKRDTNEVTDEVNVRVPLETFQRSTLTFYVSRSANPRKTSDALIQAARRNEGGILRKSVGHNRWRKSSVIGEE